MKVSPHKCSSDQHLIQKTLALLPLQMQLQNSSPKPFFFPTSFLLLSHLDILAPKLILSLLGKMMQPCQTGVEKRWIFVIIVQVRVLTGNRWHTQFGNLRKV